MKITELVENGDFVGSDSIAGAPSRFGNVHRREVSRSGDLDWHRAIKDEREQAMNPEMKARQRASMTNAKAKLAKQRSFLGRLRSFLDARQRKMFRISESFDMNDVLSRLSSLETGGKAESTTSFGIEDDDGNLMKVTVRAEQAEEFEKRLATELADAAQRKEVTGEKSAISMAELLLKLNDEFDIVDASFPTIPTDGVYNADKVQYGTPDTAEDNLGNDLDAFPEGDPNAMDDSATGMDPNTAPTDMGVDGDAMGGVDDGMNPNDIEGGDEFFDDQSVEDFPEEESVENPEQNILTAVLKMLTADADAKKAQADAEAEKARAQQAEYTAMAAKNSIEQQEEVLRMEADMERQKSQQKEAKRIADIAKYRVSKAGSFTEGTKPSFSQFIVMEFEEFDTVQTLSRKRGTLRQKYAVQPGDDADTIQYKREAFLAANKELDAQIRHAQAAARYKQAQDRAAKQNQQPNQNNKPQPNQQQQQQQQQQQNQGGQPNQQGLPDAV